MQYSLLDFPLEHTNPVIFGIVHRELAFVANKRNTIQHIVLFSWSSDNENGVTIADIEADDSWLPTIYLQGNIHSSLFFLSVYL